MNTPACTYRFTQREININIYYVYTIYNNAHAKIEKKTLPKKNIIIGMIAIGIISKNIISDVTRQVEGSLKRPYMY